MKRLVQITAITFLMIAVILLIPNTNWTENTSVIGFFILGLGTLGSVISIFIPTTFTSCFIEQHWQKSIETNDYSLFVVAKKHGLGKSPQVQTFRKEDKKYLEVEMSSFHDKKGNVTIESNIAFCGKVKIS